jgi:hypothetical protein
MSALAPSPSEKLSEILDAIRADMHVAARIAAAALPITVEKYVARLAAEEDPEALRKGVAQLRDMAIAVEPKASATAVFTGNPGLVIVLDPNAKQELPQPKPLSLAEEVIESLPTDQPPQSLPPLSVPIEVEIAPAPDLQPQAPAPAFTLDSLLGMTDD